MSVDRKLEIDLQAFDLDSLKRAAYRFSDRFAFDIAVAGTTAHCTLIFPESESPASIDAAIATFRKELLDQDLRRTIRAETDQVRNVILAEAFSRTGLVSDEPLQGD
jgi:His-Xaa-Ser system protein HxsD